MFNREEEVKISWPLICRQFRTAFNGVFCKSKKAHFDSVSPELRVVDGARTKWCSLLLLDAMIFLLEHDRFNPMSRRAFNQHEVLLRCVLEGLRAPHPESYHKFENNLRLTRSVDFHTMPVDALARYGHQIPSLKVIVCDLSASAWQSLDTLREICLSDPTAKSKGKFLSIIEELFQHKVLSSYHFDTVLITKAVLRKALHVLNNPSCFHRAPCSSVDQQQLMNQVRNQNQTSRNIRQYDLKTDQSQIVDSSDSEESFSPNKLHGTKKRKNPHGNLASDPNSAFQPMHHTLHTVSMESVGSAEDDARPETICSPMARVTEKIRHAKYARYNHRASDNDTFDGEIDGTFDLALFDNFYHHCRQHLPQQQEKNKDLLYEDKQSVRFKSAAAAAVAYCDDNVCADRFQNLTNLRSTHKDAFSCANPTFLQPWDNLEEQNLYEEEHKFPPCQIHSPIEEDGQSCDAHEDPQVAYDRIIELHEAEQSRNSKGTTYAVVTPDGWDILTNKNDYLNILRYKGDNPEEILIDENDLRVGYDHVKYCAPPPTPHEKIISNGLAQLVLPCCSETNTSTMVETGCFDKVIDELKGNFESEDSKEVTGVNDVAPFPSPCSSLHVLYGTVTSFSR